MNRILSNIERELEIFDKRIDQHMGWCQRCRQGRDCRTVQAMARMLDELEAEQENMATYQEI